MEITGMLDPRPGRMREKPQRGRPFLYAAATAFFACLPLQAQEFRVTGVTIEDVSSELTAGNFSRLAVHTVDGSGFDEATGFHTNGSDNVAWLNNGTFAEPHDPNLPGAVITFDLEANYNLSSVTVWNYNEGDVRPLAGRGAREVEILVAASEGDAFTSLDTFILDQAPAVGGVDFGQTIGLGGFPAAANARLVRFNILSAQPGTDNGFVGLSEVRFSALPTGLLLSPATLVTASGQGTVVGTLSTPSGDAGDSFTYTLTAGEGDADNGKFQIVGDELQAGAHDFAGAAAGTTFTVRVLSAGAPSGEQVEDALTVTVIDPPDADADDLLDAWEQMWAGAGNLALLSGLGGADADGDALTDLEEFDLREQFPDLDPTAADSDGDLLGDGEELAGAGDRPTTDPTNPDTDDDGLGDGAESNTGIFISPADTGSDPTMADSDGDDFSDGEEVLKGSDPNDPTSIPPVSLVAYWSFDADTDPQPDLSGFGNDAAVFPGADWADDPERGGVMEFDGNDAYLEAADSESLSLTGDLTIAAWVKVTDFAGFRGIVGKTAGPMGNLPASYDLYLVQNDGRPRLFAGSPDGGFANSDGMTVPTLEEWHHIAVSKTGIGVTFYFDGQVDAQGVIAPELLDSDAVLRIGNRTDLVTDFLGRMDDVAIFDGGLGEAQILDIMEGDFSAFGLAGAGAFRVIEVARDLDTGAFSITWNSRPGQAYTIEVTFDLSDPEGWVQLSDNWPSQGAETTFEDTFVAPGTDDQIFYRVGIRVPPATLREGFEGDAGGWVGGTIDGFAETGTHWEFGPPVGGPGLAHSGEAAAGTDLDADYDHATGISLRSPAVDLTGRGSVRLQFWHFLDAEADEGGRLNILEVDGTPIERPFEVFPGGPEGNTAEWTRRTVVLPDVDRPIVLEWEFLSGAEGGNGAGWFIDDVFIE